MKKFLRTVRFDDSDTRVFDVAAEAGEWAVSGAFAFASVDTAAITGKTRQAFANGFLGLASLGRATFVTVGEITAAAEDELIEQFAQHLVEAFGAPDQEAARAAARDELAFAADLCAASPINTVFTVRRVFTETGDVKEEFRTIKPPSGDALPHARVWTIED